MGVVAVHSISIFIISIIPGLAWLYYFYRRDVHDREPLYFIAILFASGMLAVIPAIVWQLPFRGLLTDTAGLFDRLIGAFIVIGLGEEFFKLLPVLLVAYNHRYFNEPVDGIIYSVTVSLGFASVENAIYTSAFGLAIAPLRALITTVAHATFGGIAGMYVSTAKFSGNAPFLTITKGLAIAALLHGAYDFILLGQVINPLIALLIIPVSYLFLSDKIRSLVQISPFRHK